MPTKNPKAAVCGVLAFIGLGMGAGARNLIENPGFETLDAAGEPAGWTREFNPALTHPLIIGGDVQSGKRAVCLVTEEWNYLRPQFLTQTCPLPGGVARCELTAAAKGQGLLELSLVFLNNGRPLSEEVVKLGPQMDVHAQPEAVRRIVALEQRYRPYSLAAAVPEGADAVKVKIGNSVDALNRLNVWGKAWIDDVVLSATRDAAAPAKEAPALIDAAPYSLVVMQPASFTPGNVIDGDTTTTAGYMSGLERGGNVTFEFPKPMPVTGVQLYMRGNVHTLTVRGDANGDGIFELPLARGRGLTQAGWATFPAAADRPLHAVRVQAIEGNGMHSQYRGTSPFINEAMIWVPSEAADPEAFEADRPFRPPPPLEPSVRQASLAPSDFTAPRSAERKFRRMICADLWMWGVQANKPDSPLPDFDGNPAFARTVAMVKQMDIDTILIDLTNSSGWDLMPWPSKVANGTDNNILAALIAALHAEGLEVMVEIIHNVTPFETIKWHYPEEETSRYPDMTQYPSIIHGQHVKTNWFTIMDEIMACGADGVGISSDEQYYKGHFLETMPADDPGRDIYRRRFGHEVPEHEDDTLAYRQWIVLRHEGICDLFGYWTSELKKKYPRLFTNTLLMSWEASWSYLTETGIPIDMLGRRAGIDELGSDYMGPYGICMLTAANGWRRSTMVHNGDMWPYPPQPAMHFYGTTLWNVMYGCGSINYWRFNYVVNYGHGDQLARAYAMVGDLEGLGVWDARPPKRIALLSSRAGIDWWQCRAWWGDHDDPAWDRGLEGQRGWFADRAVFDLLQQNGYPMVWKFLDHPDTLDDLGEFDALLLPFAYSVSSAAAEKLQAAADAGAHLLLFDGRMGETDEWGEPHPRPVLRGLVESGRATLYTDDILRWGAVDAFRDRVTGKLDALLDGSRPLTLNRYGRHIDATRLDSEDGTRFVFILNWDKRPATIDVGVALPEGKYNVLARNEARWFTVFQKAPAAHLEKFRLFMPAQSPLVLVIRPD